MTKRAVSGPFGTFCHHVVTKRAGSASVTKRAGSASVTKRAGSASVTKRAGSASVTKRAGSASVTKRAGSASVTKRAVVTKRAATTNLKLIVHQHMRTVETAHRMGFNLSRFEYGLLISRRINYISQRQRAPAVWIGVKERSDVKRDSNSGGARLNASTFPLL